MTSHTTGVPAQRTAPPPGAPIPGTPEPAATSADLADVPTGELVRRLSAQLSELFRRELELARTELTAKGKRAGAGAGLAGAGGVVALFGVGALIAAAVAGLATVMPVWLSALIVGVVLLIVAGVLALVGRSRLRKAAPPVPEQAVRGVQSDVSAVRNAVHR
jgi:Putative Actinobacterial Holin-X, holin superfamily III